MNKIMNKNNNISNGTRAGITFILLIVFLVFVSVNAVFAVSSFGRFFGGRIKYEISLQIDVLESTGYVCVMPGTSLTIIPIGSPLLTPIEYFIPSFVISKTGTIPTRDQLILGRYSGKTMITCTRPKPPDVKTVSLDTINLFGTSRY